MADYRLFYSWQNDRKDTKNIIKAALRTTTERLMEMIDAVQAEGEKVNAEFRNEWCNEWRKQAARMLRG